MATINSINSSIPIEISLGGTNATSMATDYGVAYFDGTNVATIASVGTATHVLTSNASAAPTFQATPGTPSLASGFLGYHTNSGEANVTGDGTVYTVIMPSEYFDIASEYDTSTYTFTADSDYTYLFIASNSMEGISSSHNEFIFSLVTSNRTYNSVGAAYTQMRQASVRVSRNIIQIADLDASDTAYITTAVAGGTKTADQDVVGDAVTFFSGYELL